MGSIGQSARAQSVTAEGDVNPFPAPNGQSTWDNIDYLRVGILLTGTLTIKEGGKVSSTNGIIALMSVASGSSVLVSGEGSIWENTDELFVGSDGIGTLTIKEGGKVSNTRGYIGFYSGASDSSVLVSGDGSIWENTGDLRVGSGGTGTLTIKEGGKVSNKIGTIGFYSVASGSSVLVSGDGSIWENTDDLRIGREGTGTLTIENGGKVSNGQGLIGFDSGASDSSVLVSGDGSIWENADDLYVGHGGTGTMTIEAGGWVNNTDGYIAYGSGASGSSVLVTGEDSIWVNDDNLYVGYYGTGTLTIKEGGKVSNAQGLIGVDSGASDSSVLVSGDESTWVNNVNLYVGYYGTGTLTIEKGGTVSNTIGYIGTSSGASGSSVLVSGKGSTWLNDGNPSTWLDDGNLYVGHYGTGTLTIEKGGKVSNAQGFIGFDSGASDSSVLVSGDESTWVNDDNLFVGHYGTGTLTIEEGGKVSNTSGVIAYGSSASGSSVLVTGEDSIWENTGNLSVGDEGTGALTIEEGGKVSNKIGSIGTFSGASGIVTVTGPRSMWVNDENLYVGYGGTGTLIIEGGSVVSVGDGLGSVFLGSLFDGSGTLNIGTATGPANTEAGTLNAARVEFGGSNDTLNFNHIGATVFSAALESSGVGTHKVNHLAGKTTLTGDSSAFTGTTTVSGGTLLVGDGAGNGRLGGVVTVGADGTLGGSGTLTGNVTIDGTLSAGNSPGTLTFDKDLTLNAGSTSVFEFNSPGIVGGTGSAGNDLVIVNGALTLSGALEANVAAAGYYRLFDYSNGTLATGSAFTTETINPTTTGFTVANHTVIYDHTAGQINLSVLGAGQTMQFWDGAAPGNGGGNGTWEHFATNWTDSSGTNSGGWGGSVGVFRGMAGTVNVSGVQSFDTLQFSSNGYVITGDALQIAAAGGGTFNIDGGVEATIESAVQDDVGSTLKKVGAGTLILSGTNSYSGGTSLLGGVLSVGADANLGAASGGLTFDGGVLRVTGTGYTGTLRDITIGAGGGGFDIADAANTFTLTKDITGAGDLVKQGDGTLVLSGTNAYGNTLVAAGTLIGNASSLSGDIGNAAELVFDQTANANFDGNIGGLNGTDGTVIKRGAGALTLTGTSALDWSVEAGGLVTAAGRFSGNADLSAGTSLAFSQTQAATYAGVLAGTGDFVLTGTGAVTLTGDSSAFNGTTTVTGNSLIVGQNGNGALGGAVTIQAGGLLGGTGDVGSIGKTVTIEADGVHAIASATGEQDVLGDYVNNGTLRIAATPAGAGRIVVGGTVDITGATLDLALSPTDAASWDIFNGPHTIIDNRSQTAVAGTFAQPYMQNLLFLDANVAYDGGDGNDVTLSLDRNDITFASIGHTRNQIATGAAVENLGNTNALWAAIALTNDDDVVRRSFDALSGEIHASAKGAMIEDSRYIRNVASDRLRAAFGDVGAPIAPVLAYGPGDTPVLVAADHAGPAFWLSGFGSWGSSDSDGNAASLDRSTGGLLIGADGLVGDWRLGVLAGYSHSHFDVKDRASSAKSDNYHLGLYGGTQWDDLALRTGVAYTWHKLDTSRSVIIPGISESLGADYHAGTFQAFGELGYAFATGAARFEPFANLAHVSLHTGGFGEGSGIAALSGQSDTTSVTFTTLGLRAEHALSGNATLHGTIGWRYAFGNVTPESTLAFQGSDAFTIAGTPIARNSALIDAGLDFNLTPDATLGLSYSGQFAPHAHDHGFRANLNVRF